MRVLIPSAGNKVRLVKAFQEAGAYVIAMDNNLEAPACKAADLAVDYTIPLYDIIIPVRDAELNKWSNSKRSVVSGEYTLSMTLDKAEFHRFCRRHGFNTPATAQFEALVKPRRGSGSRGHFVIDRSYIIQEIIKGVQEYTVDYFSDWEERPLSCIPRKRLNVIDGESQGAEIVKDPELILEATRMATELKIVGPATMQCFYDGKRITWVEVNPRFGGGSHFTWNLFNGPKWIVDNAHALLQKM
jgi:carbamoyl-phosphate synthase large subunit